jgi:hypothetical protein
MQPRLVGLKLRGSRRRGPPVSRLQQIGQRGLVEGRCVMRVEKMVSVAEIDAKAVTYLEFRRLAKRMAE